jgi:hypothetical protein
MPDQILHGRGVSPGLAAGIVRLLTDRDLRLTQARAAIAWAHTFDWEACYRGSRAVMELAALEGARP